MSDIFKELFGFGLHEKNPKFEYKPSGFEELKKLEDQLIELRKKVFKLRQQLSK